MTPPCDVHCPDCRGRGWELVDRLGRRWDAEGSPCPDEPFPRSAECRTCDGRGLVAGEDTIEACEAAYASLTLDAPTTLDTRPSWRPGTTARAA